LINPSAKNFAKSAAIESRLFQASSTPLKKLTKSVKRIRVISVLMIIVSINMGNSAFILVSRKKAPTQMGMNKSDKFWMTW
jgi:hypothetical protein